MAKDDDHFHGPPDPTGSEDGDVLIEDETKPASRAGGPSHGGGDPAGDASESGRSRVLKFANRLMDRKQLAGDTRELFSAVWNTSDKAKTEAVRLMAREFRSYLKELKLKEDLLKLMTSHSLEISIHLKPLQPPSGGSGPSDGDGK